MLRGLSSGVLLTVASLARLGAQDQRAALLDADRLTAKLSGDSGFAVSVRRSLASGGALLWPGAPVLLGATDVKAFLSSLPKANLLHLTWQPLGVELARDSTLGVTWGVMVAGGRVPSASPQMGRYILAWRRNGSRWTIAALAVVGLPGSSSTSAGLRLTQTPARASGMIAPFVEADLEFARLAGDSGAATAFETWAAPDAVIFGGGGILIRGPEAVGRAVSGPERWRWHPVAAGAAPSGDLGWTVGEAVIAGTGDPTYSKYLTVWRRRGGTIRFLIDGGNARPPTP